MEYGNKWSDIAKFLPGRTDNSIKNHFYSKLRKFIRKILKVLHKDNVFEKNCLDPNYYTSDKIYKIIKKNNIPYNTLSKELILEMILIHNRGSSEATKSIQRMTASGKRKFKKIVFFSLSKNKVKKKKLLFKLKNKNNLRKIDETRNITSNPEKKMGQMECQVTNVNKNDVGKSKENINKQYIHDMFLNPSNNAPFAGNFEFNINKNIFNKSNNNIPLNDYILPNIINSVPTLSYNPAINNIQLANRINELHEVERSQNIFHPLNKNLKEKDVGYPQQSFQSQPEFTVKLLQTLSKISNDSKSSNNKDSIDQNSINYFNFSGAHTPQVLNELYTFNNRFLPQVNLNHNMSSFTLANNNTINNSIHDNMIQPTNINEIENPPYVNNLNSYNFQNVQQGDININNLMIGPSCVKNNYNNSVNINYPANANLNFIKSSSHDFNDIIKNSFDSDCFFHDKNQFNFNTLSQNMNRSFYQFKSFNCLDPDVLNDDCNISSIFHNKKSLGNISTNSTPNMNMNINNSISSVDGNNLDNIKKFMDMHNYINLKNNSHSFNYNLSNISANFNSNITSTLTALNANINSKYNSNYTQVFSPRNENSNGLNVSPRSAFVKNLTISDNMNYSNNSGAK